MSNYANQVKLSDLRSIPISTKPSRFRLKDGKTGVAYKATRLAFKRKGIQLLKGLDELIVIEIFPNSEKEGYIPGYVVLTLRQFRESFPNVIASGSYSGKIGVYNPPDPPESMKPFFMATQ
jgi:hypothetical protein